MKNTKTKLLLMPFWVILSVFIIAACSTEQFDELEAEDVELKKASAQNKLLAQIKSATAKYHRLDAAVADGYVLDPHCVEHQGLGGMGHHAIIMSRVFIPAVIPSEPAVLVYEPMKNGKYKLVAVEFLINSKTWHD
jgi:hypothetical protein